MIPLNNAQEHSSYGYGAETDFYIIVTIPLLVNIFSFLGSLYIFYRTFVRWKNDRRNISLSFRFPFYISITDFVYSSCILMEFTYVTFSKSEFVNNKQSVTWPYLFCEIIGLGFTFIVLLNILLVGAISIVTWLRVVREHYLDLGRYDYKVWLPILFVSSIIPLSTVYAHGSRGYSCGTKIGYQIVGFIVLAIILVTLTTIIICYASVMRAIRKIKEVNESITNSHNNLIQINSVERKTFKKILTYILVFILQYVPIMIYNVCGFLKVRHVILDALIPAVISLGGIGNIIQFLYNEGLSANKYTSNYKLESNEQSQKSNNTMSEL
ncbi:hypothetical protein RhiirB3_524350 [Rhizophagus irregularis]|nr:hypothetical protein RhiirB3_524350 [Rhizophagus irregularis]